MLKQYENPSIPTIGAIPPFEAASTNKVPIIGPVQEKETIASANAMKYDSYIFHLYRLDDRLYSPMNWVT